MRMEKKARWRRGTAVTEREDGHVDDDVLTSLRDAAAGRNRIPRVEQQISDDGRTDGQTSC